MQTILLPFLTDAYNSLTYLYRLKPGFAGTSHAVHCARLCGVPESVADRADRICSMGLRSWQDAEAVRDEAIVRRLLQLELGNELEGPEWDALQQQQQGDMREEEARAMLNWVLHGDDDLPTSWLG